MKYRLLNMLNIFTNCLLTILQGWWMTGDWINLVLCATAVQCCSVANSDLNNTTCRMYTSLPGIN